MYDIPDFSNVLRVYLLIIDRENLLPYLDELIDEKNMFGSE